MTILPKSQLLLLHNLMGYVVRLRPDTILAILLGIASSTIELASMAVLFPLSRLASHVPIANTSPWHRLPVTLGFQPDVKFFVIAFLALILLRTVSQTIAGILAQHLNRSLIAYFSGRSLEAFIHHLSFSEVQKASVGHFVTIAGDEANRAAQIVTAIIKLIPLLVLFVLYAVMLIYQSWRSGVALFMFSLFTVLCLLGVFRKSHKLGIRQQMESRVAGTHFIESLSGLRTVRSFNGEKFVTSRYDEMIGTYTRICFRIDVLNQVASATPTLMLAGGLLVAAWQFTSNQQLILLLPVILVGVMMVLRLLPLAAQALDIALRLTSDLKAAENISEMLDAVKSANVLEIVTKATLTRPIKAVQFDRVSFRYSEDTPEILNEFSMTFEAGKSYAICGPSGVGKSTIVDLLLKFYVPQKGTIRVNGRDVSELSDASLRQRIVLSEQTTRVFYDTIEHNVQFGYGASRQNIADALEMVGLSELMAMLPQGQQTLLNYQGSNISGGQRQRIGLARALLRNADVLIMDESTSALDHATRERVLANIFPQHRDGILIFIAHDPAILNRVDEVILLESASPARAEPIAVVG